MQTKLNLNSINFLNLVYHTKKKKSQFMNL